MVVTSRRYSPFGTHVKVKLHNRSVNYILHLRFEPDKPHQFFGPRMYAKRTTWSRFKTASLFDKAQVSYDSISIRICGNYIPAVSQVVCGLIENLANLHENPLASCFVFARGWVEKVMPGYLSLVEKWPACPQCRYHCREKSRLCVVRRYFTSK